MLSYCRTQTYRDPRMHLDPDPFNCHKQLLSIPSIYICFHPCCIPLNVLSILYYSTMSRLSLRLRRARKASQTTNPERVVSNPTFLGRVRSSISISSKDMLFGTCPYESVTARTPPIPISRPDAATRPPIRRPKPYGALHAGWRAASRRLSTPEQRDSLFGAECIEIRDPLLGRLGQSEILSVQGGVVGRPCCKPIADFVIDSPEVSIDLESDMSNLSISVVQEDSMDVAMGGIDNTPHPSPVSVKHQYHTLVHTPTPHPHLHNLIQYSALRKRVPTTFTSKSLSHQRRVGPFQMSPIRERERERTPEFMAVDHDRENTSPLSSPIMIPANPPSTPRPRSPTRIECAVELFRY